MLILTIMVRTTLHCMAQAINRTHPASTIGEGEQNSMEELGGYESQSQVNHSGNSDDCTHNYVRSAVNTSTIQAQATC